MTTRLIVPLLGLPLAFLLVIGWVLSPAVSPGSSESAALFPIISHGKYGYINQTGKVVIAPQFEKAKRFSEGLARVQIGGNWGFIDATGRIAIPPQFTIDERLENDNSLDFHEGMAAASVDHGKKWGFIDKSGNMSIAPQFGAASRFSDGIAEVSDLGPYPRISRYIDKSGKILAFPIVGGTFSEGLAVVSTSNEEDRKEGYIDRAGQIRIQAQFTIASPFHEGLARVQPLNKTNRWGYIDTTGKIVIPPRYLSSQQGSGDFSQGLAAMQNFADDKWGFIDKTGTFVIEPRFFVVGQFSDGVAGACVENQGANEEEEGLVCGYIDPTGKWVFSRPIGLVAMTDFYEGLALTVEENFWGYINKKGAYVWRSTELDPGGFKICSWNFDYEDKYRKKCRE